MKTRPKLLILLLVVVFSCKPNENTTTPVVSRPPAGMDKITLEQAKGHYESETANVRTAANGYDAGEPDWENAKSTGMSITVPLKYKNKKAFMIAESIDIEKIKKKLKDKAVSGISTMTLSKTKDNQYYAYITEYIPDEDFKYSFNPKSFDREDDPINKKFSGSIITRTKEGEFVSEVMLRNGKTVSLQRLASDF